MSTLAVSAAVDATYTPPRIRVTVTDTGTPAITSVTVTRTDASGNTATVRTTDGNALPLSGTAFVDDFEAPYGTPVTYSTTAQPANTSAAVTLAVTRVWLVDPGVPSRSMAVTISAFADRTRAATRGVFYPLGRANAVVVTDGQRKAPAGELTLTTASDSEADSLAALLDSTRTLLMNVPASKPWNLDRAYISVGDVTENRPGRVLSDPTRLWTLPYVVTDTPVGGAQAVWTWANVMATYSTWSALMAANPTWAALQTPVP